MYNCGTCIKVAEKHEVIHRPYNHNQSLIIAKRTYVDAIPHASSKTFSPTFTCENW